MCQHSGQDQSEDAFLLRKCSKWIFHMGTQHSFYCPQKIKQVLAFSLMFKGHAEIQSFSIYIPHYIPYSEFRLTKKFGNLFASDYNVFQKVAIVL